MKHPKSDKSQQNQVIATHRRARFDYTIEDKLEAGIALLGSEVKSARAGTVSLSDGYAEFDGKDLWLKNCHIGEYQPAAHFGHTALRGRKLLLNRAELDRLQKRVDQRGYTLIPLSLYFKNGWAKVELGLGKGRTHEDRRGAIAERETKREMERAASPRRRTDRP